MEPTKEIDLAIIDVILREPEHAENFLPELDTRQTAKVVSLILDICPICLAASRTCSCLHDE
jgi:hypothetical protein